MHQPWASLPSFCRMASHLDLGKRHSSGHGNVEGHVGFVVDWAMWLEVSHVAGKGLRVRAINADNEVQERTRAPGGNEHGLSVGIPWHVVGFNGKFAAFQSG